MKKRRTVVAVFLIVAILTLGIGYAALSDDLTVTAGANSPAFDPNVYFASDYDITSGTRNGAAVSDVKSDDTSNDDYAITVSGTGTDEIVIDVDSFLATKDDEIVLVFTVVNESNFEVTLSNPTVTAAGTDGTFTATAVLAATTLAPKTGTTTLTVTITMANDISGNDAAEETFTIAITANA